MDNSFRVGIAGLGTVGRGVVRTLQKNRELLRKRVGRELAVVAVCARSRSKERGIALDAYEWEADPARLAARPDIDAFVELMGGEDGDAKRSVEAAIGNGKHVVTANKALLAVHGHALAEAAEQQSVALRFEAAVAGGIPVIKALGESLAGDRITRVVGVLNGTCNYILTRMEKNEASYPEIFSEAQSLGYLEADPTLDVGGIDAAHKLALLASLAYGTRVDFGNVDIEGIERISLRDIEQTRDMGYRVKLLCVARMSEEGLEQRTQPCLVPRYSTVGRIDGATNIVLLEGEATGQISLQGPGAGEGPTATAVVGDIVGIARGSAGTTFGQPAATLVSAPPARSAVPVPYYLRLSLRDEPGAFAEIALALAWANVSIDRIRQYAHATEAAPVIIVTHATTRARLDRALDEIRRSEVSLREPVSIRIEEI
ncbi:MAG: homoserine dehydrogenase [Rhodobacteraceae bacterium]|nr:homoserine dehydrogenase [Paracoccaceae bacterium]